MSDSKAEFELTMDPDDPWNIFVNYAWGAVLPEPGTPQRGPVLVERYAGEVQNGGHFQYFANGYMPLAHETVSALRDLDGAPHADLLEEAIRLASTQMPDTIDSVEQYLQDANANEAAWAHLDLRFIELSPSANDLLQLFVDSHVGLFPRTFEPARESHSIGGGRRTTWALVGCTVVILAGISLCARW